MNVQRVAAVASIVIVVAAVGGGLFVTGAPSEQRLLRLDDERVGGLRMISSTASYRWDADQRLPDSAAELVNGQDLSRLPEDPSSGQPYEYRITGPRAFEVCAVFDRSSRPGLAGDFWFHEAGRQCFAFEMTERSGR